MDAHRKIRIIKRGQSESCVANNPTPRVTTSRDALREAKTAVTSWVDEYRLRRLHDPKLAFANLFGQ